VALLLLCCASVAAAQTDEERALVLEAEARTLRESGRMELACARLDEALVLARTAKRTALLADCREASGRLATAWRAWREAAELARGSDAATETAAAARATALWPRLPRLRLEVEAPAEGLVIEVDDVAVDWSTPLPVDPGRHWVVADAPRHEPWDSVVEAPPEGETRTVAVPALALRSTPLPPLPPEPVAEEGAGDVQRIVALVLGGVALTGIAVGAGFGILAIDKASEYKDHCDAERRCTSEGLDLHDDAAMAATVSNATFAVGVAAGVTGLVVWLTAP
jgi:hypothetical protein